MQNVFFLRPDKDGKAPIPETITGQLPHFLIDPHTTKLDLPHGKVRLDADMGFLRIDDRFATMKYATTFTCLTDPRLGTDFPYISRVTGGGFPPYNALAK